MGDVFNQSRVELRRFIAGLCLALLALLSMGSQAAFANPVKFPDKPAPHSFVVDQAGLLSAADLEAVNSLSQALQTEHRIPVYVVTLNSLSEYGARYMSIGLYAQSLFDEWGIGYENRNYGMLLLISKSDRRMRIELGRDWAGGHDQDAKYLVDRVLTPRFKEGYFSEGIVEGVRGMDAMARGLSLPSPFYEWWVVPSLVTFIFLAICISISMFRSGKNGVGWGFLIIAFAVAMYLFEIILSSLSDGGDGDGFGGGVSGGGGASGGW